MNGPADRRLVEDVEVLAGRRAAERDNAAVRRSDLRDLANLKNLEPMQHVQFAFNAPTQAEHNALVDRVNELQSTLKAVALVLTRRLNEQQGVNRG